MDKVWTTPGNARSGGNKLSDQHRRRKDRRGEYD